MNPNTLGRLQKVDLRQVWTSEAAGFTPWLAQEGNLRLLGETIGIDLELKSQERDVGPFRADILCKDTANDSWVLIENQLERTDHCHLGQLLTYAAGLECVTVVWLAERFTEEHRAALDWLNERTEDGINFFGLEVELWRIGDSAIAPKFNIVSKPNEWTRNVINTRRDTEARQNYLEYWSGVAAKMQDQAFWSAPVKPMRKGNIKLPTGWSNFRLRLFTNSSRKRIGIYLTCQGPQAQRDFELLSQDKAHVEKLIGRNLEWDLEDDQGRAYIALCFAGCDPLNEEDWDRQHLLLAEHAGKFIKAFNGLISKLDPSPSQVL